MPMFLEASSLKEIPPFQLLNDDFKYDQIHIRNKYADLYDMISLFQFIKYSHLLMSEHPLLLQAYSSRRNVFESNRCPEHCGIADVAWHSPPGDQCR